LSSCQSISRKSIDRAVAMAWLFRQEKLHLTIFGGYIVLREML
jgi:hypothetical protein